VTLKRESEVTQGN